MKIGWGVPDIVRRGGKTNRKHGRTKRKPSSQRYTLSRRWLKNKARNIIKQMKKFPNYKIPANLNADVKSLVLKYSS